MKTIFLHENIFFIISTPRNNLVVMGVLTLVEETTHIFTVVGCSNIVEPPHNNIIISNSVKISMLQ